MGSLSRPWTREQVMTTPYERAKSAWESDDREAALNRVFEEMADEGVTLDILDEALCRLLMEVRASGADDDTEEIINCVGDRLNGWCHESGHIKTKPASPPEDTSG